MLHGGDGRRRVIPITSVARARRVADRIQEELAELLIREVSDPRLSMVTVTGVDVDRELAVAKVYVVADERSEEHTSELQSH